MIVTVTGIRDLARSSYAVVADAVVRELADDAAEMRFGGARGLDTVALQAAWEYYRGGSCNCRFVVVVPFSLGQQPREARDLVRGMLWQHDLELVELHLPWSKIAYHGRNVAMVDGSFRRPMRRADRVLAFSDGRQHGGTWQCREHARSVGCEVVDVLVASDGGGR